MKVPDITKIVAHEDLFPAMKALLDAGEQVRLRVRGRSMRPMLEHNRDAVFLQRALSSAYVRGDVVIAHTSEGQWVLHRIVSCDEQQCTLQGDGNIAGQELCLRSEIIGKVVKFERNGRLFSTEHSAYRCYVQLWMQLVSVRRVLLWGYEACHRLMAQKLLHKRQPTTTE